MYCEPESTLARNLFMQGAFFPGYDQSPGHFFSEGSTLHLYVSPAFSLRLRCTGKYTDGRSAEEDPAISPVFAYQVTVLEFLS